MQAEGAAFGAALQALWALARAQRGHVDLRHHRAPRQRRSRALRTPGSGSQRCLCTGLCTLPQSFRCHHAAPARLMAPPRHPYNDRSTHHERTPFIGAKGYFPGVGRIPFEGRARTIRLPSRSTMPAGSSVARPCREHLRFAVCYWHTFCNAGHDPFGPGTRRDSVGGRRHWPRQKQRWTQRSSSSQAGRAVLVLPRYRPGAGCRRHRPVPEEPFAYGGPGQSTPGGLASSCCGATCSRTRAT